MKKKDKDPITQNVKSAIKLAKKNNNILEISIHSDELEPAFTEPSNGIEYPSREGFSSEDISGYCLPDSWSHYFKVVKDNFKETKDSDGLKLALSFLQYDLFLPWQRWIWTLDSTEYVAHEIVESIYGPKVKKKKSDKEYYYKNLDNLVKAVSQEEILAYLDKNYKKLNDNIWVSPTDYADFQYNHFNKPYALKNGWSKSQVEEIIQEWVKVVMNESLTVRFVNI